MLHRNALMALLAAVIAIMGGLPAAMAQSASASAIRNATTGQSYAKLDEALSAARSGETVEISGGPFPGNFVVDEAITLRGVARGQDLPALDGEGRGTVLSILASGTTVENVAVVNSAIDRDPFLYWGSSGIAVRADAVVLRDLHVAGNGWGILMFGGNGSTVENSVIADNFLTGIKIMGGHDHRILGNAISGNGDGIMIDALHVDERSSLDSAGNPESVARLDLDRRMARRSEDITVSGNTVRGNAVFGIAAAWYGRRITIAGNTVHLTGVERKPDAGRIAEVEREITAGLGGKAVATINPEGIGNGIHLFCGIEDSVVDANRSFDNAGSGVGLVADNDNRVSRNLITGNQTGIALQSSNNNRIEANTVANNAQYGIRIGSPSPMEGHSDGNLITLNDIAGSAVNAYDSAGSTATEADLEAMIDALPMPENVKQQLRTDATARQMYLEAIRKTLKPGSNRWDDGALGNRYGDFDEPGEGFLDKDGDGISETVRPIEGGLSVDRRPLDEATVKRLLAQ